MNESRIIQEILAQLQRNLSAVRKEKHLTAVALVKILIVIE